MLAHSSIMSQSNLPAESRRISEEKAVLTRRGTKNFTSMIRQGNERTHVVFTRLD